MKTTDTEPIAADPADPRASKGGRNNSQPEPSRKGRSNIPIPSDTGRAEGSEGHLWHPAASRATTGS